MCTAILREALPEKKKCPYMIDLENNYQKEQAARRVRPPDIEQLNPVEELEQIMTSLEERHKLPRRVVLTRWLSSEDAIRVILNSRLVYINYFSNETNDAASEILERFACLHDVIPVLTRMNVLFQSTLPLPHLLYPRISTAKATLVNMVGTGGARTEMTPVEAVDGNTSFGAYANKFIRDIPVWLLYTQLHSTREKCWI